MEKGEYNTIAIALKVNNSKLKNGVLTVYVNGNKVVDEAGLLFYTGKTRNVYVIKSGKFNDRKVPKTSGWSDPVYIVNRDLTVYQAEELPPPPPPPSPPPPSPPSPPLSLSPPPSPPQEINPSPIQVPEDLPETEVPTGSFQWADLTDDQYRRTLLLTSIFENANLTLQYGYCNNLNDGRGFTFGFCGFVTKHADAKRVMREYLLRRPDDEVMAMYLENMTVSSPGNDGTHLLNGFCDAVKERGNDPDFRAAQDKIQKEMYYFPSREWGIKVGARMALTKAQIYDAMINHGQGRQDPFSIDHIVDKTNAKVGVPLDGADEIKWLEEFLNIREKTLYDAGGKPYARRISFYRELLEGQNYNLDGPIYVSTEKQGNGWTITNVFYGKFEIYSGALTIIK